MTELLMHANGLYMDLRTVCPDGQVVITRWPENKVTGRPEPFLGPNQRRHAAEHLQRVKDSQTVNYRLLMEESTV